MKLRTQISRALKSDDIDEVKCALRLSVEIMGCAPDGVICWEIAQCLVCGENANTNKGKSTKHERDCPAR